MAAVLCFAMHGINSEASVCIFCFSSCDHVAGAWHLSESVQEHNSARVCVRTCACVVHCLAVVAVADANLC